MSIVAAEQAKPNPLRADGTPNPNWKINKAKKVLEKRFKFKIMYQRDTLSANERPLMGRAFQNRDKLLTFAYRKARLCSVWLYEWDAENFEWIPLKEETRNARLPPKSRPASLEMNVSSG